MIDHDSVFMARALQLARQGLYTTAPNPRVGCVLVKDGDTIAEGWHRWAGQAHAEIDALSRLDRIEDARGATVYVTLEPCSHQGRTAPCCDALIAAGVTRVVVAMQDPNPLVVGKGLKRLQAAGIEVVCGVLEAESRRLNRGFISRMVRHKPFVCSKLAMSLDGRTALASGESRWITSPQARTDVQQGRAESDAILTGIDTVLADDPSLNVRIESEVKQPVRIVLDSNLRMPPQARMLTLPGETWVVTACYDKTQWQPLLDAGCHIEYIEPHQGRVDLAKVMRLLADRQINNVWVEAGARLNGALLAADQVDEWRIYLAPCVLGDQALGAFALPALQSMAQCKRLRFTDVRHLGPDLRLTLTMAESGSDASG
ncbi:MAG: bifunctional diaminohydroxyphosphoribosylaminopyrimidine deaminase/5-amino-6-(5-phosphoribosylamino)uracil reductase RibD [Methylomonas sp.]|nr:bifunctional diaminohydroxyphosphoribosylaminopyrimidine deaminase/5-amino-6-(5-phosphoribosylamino)uracil reductase RibD [Methylomonas sp.]PPD22145.1 MAG: riboflavin biosynthesis protein RibD [Methylomonas sp.]PPD26159.1 MAG: riboflavin biosynthesis protein RibD [Methylomonas sp.]PPD37874.1 MAG: riboflavin biosynthesis protein RibD [Methylomonas sp.]PPD42470.1 MAG: riboflavin biosynthesis protein RibD [Methylomonas sp.]